jgi:hypothetical protein
VALRDETVVSQVSGLVDDPHFSLTEPFQDLEMRVVRDSAGNRTAVIARKRL